MMTSTRLRFWFTFDEPVPRGVYLRHGLALAAVKYVGDAAIVWFLRGEIWTPLDYVRTLSYQLTSAFGADPPYVLFALSIWALPFIWIGTTMTMRRALDAGRSAWLTLLFFVPYLNYLLMALLSVLPTDTQQRHHLAQPIERNHRLPRALMSMGAGLLIGLGMIVVSVELLDSYGMALFIGTPVVLGAITAWLLNRRFPATSRETHEVVLMTVALVAGAALLLGEEGAICLIMSLPLGIPLGLIGGVLGRVIATHGGSEFSHAAIVLIALPSAAALEGDGAPLRVREVRSSIEIAASPEQVWTNVIAFPALDEPTELWFRAGIAYPTSARITGSGVGAVRYCEFSTGAFVEPITHWEPGRRLAFDVSESPPPMREWTFRDGVAPPHLDDFLRPVRGEFRLVPLPGGRTRLEGSTWYELRIQPVPYWGAISDWLIARIHLRVLDHIRRNAE